MMLIIIIVKNRPYHLLTATENDQYVIIGVRIDKI